MITLKIEVPFATCRKSFARSFAETYPVPPPATVYGMLLSLVGERFRIRHEGVRLAFAYNRLPRVTTTLRKLSRYKYGIASKQSKLGNAPDYVESLCGLEFLCWVDSSDEVAVGAGQQTAERKGLESRLIEAIQFPERVDRYGILCLGLSDDAVNDIRLCEEVCGSWHRLIPSESGDVELPIWVDHVGSINTRWQRFQLDQESVPGMPPSPGYFTRIVREPF